MKWFRDFFQSGQKVQDTDLQVLRDRFANFLALLEKNNVFLKIIGDMEEKSQGEHLFDMSYIDSCVAELRSVVAELIERMIALGGNPYVPLRAKFEELDAQLEDLLSGGRTIKKDEFTLFFEKLDRDRIYSVGGKNAQLGEMKSRLGLPVPEGFAITAWAYKHFIDSNDLQARITDRIRAIDIKRHEDLVRVSEDIRKMVCSSPVADDLAEAIRRSCAELVERSGSARFSLRSSAIGEDTLFSFAGQYATFLDLRCDEVVDRYRSVLASKFTPQAIYYFLSHALSESELAMSVSCVTMVDAAASGVVYSRDPVRPENDCVLISSIYGLGKYLVDGTLTPDVFRVSRSNGAVLEAHPAKKPVRLLMQPGGGTREEAVPEEVQDRPSLGDDDLRLLAGYATRIEAHYGCPQDIEWALDREGRMFLLQTRPLRVIPVRPPTDLPDVSSLEVLRSGGTTVCPGAGCGPVCHVSSTADLGTVPEGAVLVAPHPFPGLITVMGRIHALVTEVGSVASHMATLAREYRIPTLVGVARTEDLAAGSMVTIDATGCLVYAGIHPELEAARRPESELFDDMAIYSLLSRIAAKVSPLNLLNPSDPDFRPEKCRTFHDITRFVHQRSMEEMFTKAKNMEHKDRFGVQLKSDIPLDVNIIYIDQDLSKYEGKRWITEAEIESVPMQSLWNGIKHEGWPSNAPQASVGGLMSVLTTHLSTGDQLEFSESSFAILGREYMILSLRLGYHFTTIEALCTEEPSKNYIRIQQKGGGASLDRRTRRIKLIMDLLSRMGFEHTGRGDFLDSSVSYLDSSATLEALFLLGRTTMLTRQLDMALSNENITLWYTTDIMKKLGLSEAQGAGPCRG